MVDQNKAELARAIAVTAELTGTNPPLSPGAVMAMVEHLAQHSLDLVQQALTRCQMEVRGRLTLSDVLDRLQDGRPGPEEAWGMVSGVDDDQTVVWTTEIAEAWGAARFLLDEPVQARLAFLEVYRQRIAIGRAHQRAPQWQIYLGYNEALRAAPIFAAIEAGRIQVAQGKTALPPHEWPVAWREDRALPEGAAVQRAEVAALVLTLANQIGQARQPILPPAEEGSLRKALEDGWTQP